MPLDDYKAVYNLYNALKEYYLVNIKYLKILYYTQSSKFCGIIAKKASSDFIKENNIKLPQKLWPDFKVQNFEVDLLKYFKFVFEVIQIFKVL